MGKLDGQVAIVTGGSRGIGRAVALAFAREGARAVITAVEDRQALEKTEGEIVALGADGFGMLANVARRGDIDRLVQSVIAKWGRIDILVNNAGILRLAPLENISEERWDETRHHCFYTQRCQRIKNLQHPSELYFTNGGHAHDEGFD